MPQQSNHLARVWTRLEDACETENLKLDKGMHSMNRWTLQASCPLCPLDHLCVSKSRDHWTHWPPTVTFMRDLVAISPF